MILKKSGNGQKIEKGFIIAENCGCDFDNPQNTIVMPLRLDDIYAFDCPIWDYDYEESRRDTMQLAFYERKETAERMCKALNEKEKFRNFEVLKMEISFKISR